MVEQSDIIIDTIGAIFMLGAFAHALTALWYSRKQSLTKGRIFFLFVCIVSAIYIYQTFIQMITGEFANKNVWDILNFLSAVTLMMAVSMIGKLTGCGYSARHPNDRFSHFP